MMMLRLRPIDSLTYWLTDWLDREQSRKCATDSEMDDMDTKIKKVAKATVS